MSKFIVTVTVDGSGTHFEGGLPAGNYSFLVEAETISEALTAIHPGKDIEEVHIKWLFQDKTE